MIKTVVRYLLPILILGNGIVMGNHSVIEPTIKSMEKEHFLTASIEGDQLYLNVPEQVLDKPMLFTCFYDKRRSHMQVIWSLHRNNIVLKSQSIISTSGIILPVVKGLTVRDNILAKFPTETKNEGQGGYRINITKLILHQDISWPQRFGVSFGSPIPEISILEGVKTLRDELIIKTRRGMVKHGSRVSAPVYYGFYALGRPMKGREYDYRMGFINEDFMGIKHGIQLDGPQNSKANIAKRRLEKKYGDRTLSVPVKPIVFTLSPEIPKKWRPYIKAGIEEWLPAFEAAGFKDAIVVRETDSLNDWERNSLRNNMVYWGEERYFRDPDATEYGGTIGLVIDYRSGEILRGDIFLNASRQTLEDQYFVRAATLDKRAQSFPFPDDLTGQLFQSLTAHETGHALGLNDGNFGEHSYPVEKMNDIDWLESMGFTPSIMNYTRPNNIPQPEDSIPPSLLVQKVGPTDLYSIRWAYKEFPSGTSAMDESIALEEMVRLQDSISWFRYNDNQLEIIGPGRTNEVVETNDPVKSTSMALKNLERAIALMPNACSDQKDNTRLMGLYNKSLDLWYHHVKHVVSVIGGYEIQYQSINQKGNLFEPINLKFQEEALEFILSEALKSPKWLTDPEFLDGIRHSTFPDRVLTYQQKLLLDLLSAPRLKRIEQMEKRIGRPYLLQEYLESLQTGLFAPLVAKDFGTMDRRRQEIQIAYITEMIRSIETQGVRFEQDAQFFTHSAYVKGLKVSQLMALKKKIITEQKGRKDSPLLGHWQRCLKEIDSFLDSER